MYRLKKTIYRVAYKYRRQRRSANERWKARYRWVHETILVTCQDRYQVESMILMHLNQSKKDEYTIEMKIMELSKVSSIYTAEGQ